MDTIFRKCHSCFTVVRIARDEPRRFGGKGELLINYEETEEHAFRQASVARGASVGGAGIGIGGGDLEKAGARGKMIENAT